MRTPEVPGRQRAVVLLEGPAANRGTEFSTTDRCELGLDGGHERGICLPRHAGRQAGDCRCRR